MKKYNLPTQEELIYIDSIKSQKKFGRDDQVKMYSIYNRLFNEKARPGGCGRCLAEKHKALMYVLNENPIEPIKVKRGRPKKEN